MRSTDLSKTTVDRYEGILRVHIVPEFGSRGLDEVKYRDLRAFVMAKSKSMVMSRRKDQENDKARRKLSRDSLRLIVTTLRRLFAEAVELEYL